MALNQNQKQKLINMEIDKQRKQLTWPDFLTIINSVQVSDQQAFLSVFLNADRPVINQLLDQSVRQAATDKINGYESADSFPSSLVIKLLRND